VSLVSLPAYNFLHLPLYRTYSPLHAALWYLVQPENWKIVLFVMVVTTFQLGALLRAYSQLIKDREILSAEVMYEYNTRVRLNPDDDAWTSF